MRGDKTVAFRNATEALSQLGIPGMLPTLHEAGVQLQRTILGGSHSVVTYPPLNALKPLILGNERPAVQFDGEVNLYVHIAFCETQCSFCRYTVQTYRGSNDPFVARRQAVIRYLEALRKEINAWGVMLRGEPVNSIYIGGGTPLVLETKQLTRLLRDIRRAFNVRPDAEICIEGSPLTITADDGREKLEALKEAGVTRFSFGVQSFDDEVLKRAARGYERDTAIKACEIASSVFENWNLDLIQSLYKGTPAEVWENIRVLGDMNLSHVTWYHARVTDRPQAHWRAVPAKQRYFEGEYETLLGRELIWQQLTRMGMHQVDGNRFVSSKRFIDPFKGSRTSVTSSLLGVGASSYSHTDDIFFRNVTSIDQYVANVEAGEVTIGSYLPITAKEKLAASYVIGLRTGRVQSDAIDRLSVEHPALARHYRGLVNRLHELGLVEKVDEVLGLTHLGRLFEDEILAMFYSPDVMAALA